MKKTHIFHNSTNLTNITVKQILRMFSEIHAYVVFLILTIK